MQQGANIANGYRDVNDDDVTDPFRPWANAALDDTIFAGTGGTATLGMLVTVLQVTRHLGR